MACSGDVAFSLGSSNSSHGQRRPESQCPQIEGHRTVHHAVIFQVRVSRKRILESAAKVMELYADSRAVLELEFFGEVRL